VVDALDLGARLVLGDLGMPVGKVEVGEMRQMKAAHETRVAAEAARDKALRVDAVRAAREGVRGETDRTRPFGRAVAAEPIRDESGRKLPRPLS
jgi:hypothetical protein